MRLTEGQLYNFPSNEAYVHVHLDGRDPVYLGGAANGTSVAYPECALLWRWNPPIGPWQVTLPEGPAVHNEWANNGCARVQIKWQIDRIQDLFD